MTDNDIINLYDRGNSIEFIANIYYRYRNSNIRENYYENDRYIVTKKNITKDEARYYVSNVILKHITKKGP